MEKQKLTKEQKIVKKILGRLSKWFTKKKTKQIAYIKVTNSQQIYYVKNPKKIKYWKTLAEKSATMAFASGDNAKPTIRIIKVVYNE